MYRADGGFFQQFKNQKILSRIPAGKVIVAVSGGADSVALLHCLWRMQKEKKWELVVAHVQHNLRGAESAKNERFVESYARKLYLNFRVRSIKVKDFSKENKMGIEEAGRSLRYRALGEFARELGARSIAVAHNANDQAETLLLNLLRGAGPNGLCGMRPARSLVEVTGNRADEATVLVRPLLRFSKKKILAYLRSQKLGCSPDKSNRSLIYRRNWVRHKLIPLMEKVQPKTVQNLVQLSLYMQRAQLDGDGVFRYDLPRKIFKNEDGGRPR